ncbi:glycosyltransferase family 1 protein [Candidatus Bathyarchaeota archaeon]|nr:MAG: glycosyltransferase family 1 protein [Candidatus Bathyarchaeota archaeon]
MKILQIVNNLPPYGYGIENHVYNLSVELAKLNVEVVIFTKKFNMQTDFKLYKAYFDMLEKLGVKIVSLPYSNLGYGSVCFFEPISFLNQILREKPSLIRVHGFWSFYMPEAILASRMFKIPIVLTVHGIGKYNEPSIIFYDKFVSTFFLNRANKIIAVSNTVKDELKKRGVKDSRIIVIPNGVDYCKYENLPDQDLFRKLLGINSDEKIILALGRIKKEKGFQFLIKAMPKILEVLNGKVVLVICGQDFGYKKNLEKLIKNLGLTGKVIFLGFVDGKLKLQALSSSSVVVLPSLYEAFGLVAVEALAAGKPLVTSKFSGFLDFMENKDYIWVVEPTNIQQLADTIVYVLTNGLLSANLAKNAKNIVKIFSWEKIAKQTMRVYEKVLVSRLHQ